jgi:hypothetical protein
MPAKRTAIVGGITATAIVGAIVLGIVSGGGGAGHLNTSLDASASAAPPTDWRRGYSRTGTICYAQDATGLTATCFAANVLPYTVDATDTGWPSEPSQNNRFPVNVSGACSGAPWVCSTATMDSTSADPAGGTTASSITMGGGSLDATAFGFANDAELDFRMYVKCSSGTLDASHVNAAGGLGHWSVNCTTVGGAWRLLDAADTAVTESEAWKADSGGNLTVRLSGADATIWHATATVKTAYAASTRLRGTIPTTDATGTVVGASAWTTDNSHGRYWAASGVTKVEASTVHNGTCWSYSAPTITLSGCHGIWYALDLTWSN